MSDQNHTWQERFRSHYRQLGQDECWPWESSLSACGYGRFKLGGKVRIASRLAYEMARGQIPPGQCVCHSCDNPACVNPSHLFLGTHVENMHDRDKKGRNKGRPLFGEDSPKSKLSADKMLRVREMALSGERTQRAIAREFGISQAAVSLIKNGRRWPNHLQREEALRKLVRLSEELGLEW